MSIRQQEVRAFAPATVANLGPGFDILGLAVEGIGDTVTARRSEVLGVRIRGISGDQGKLPSDPSKNTAGIAAFHTLQAADAHIGVELEIHKGLPIASGLGSSAASAVAAAVAVNHLLGAPLRKMQLIAPCLAAEAEVAGRHADNIAPALLGGLIFVRSLDPVQVLRLPVPAGLQIVIAAPAFELSTERARQAIPQSIPVSAMVRNSTHLATLISACYTNDLSLLCDCIRDDVVTPARAALIPGAQAVIDAALQAGALGSSISGAGPSIFALCHSTIVAQAVGKAMKEAFSQAGLDAAITHSSANCPGARILANNV